MRKSIFCSLALLCVLFSSCEKTEPNLKQADLDAEKREKRQLVVEVTKPNSTVETYYCNHVEFSVVSGVHMVTIVVDDEVPVSVEAESVVLTEMEDKLKLTYGNGNYYLNNKSYCLLSPYGSMWSGNVYPGNQWIYSADIIGDENNGF